MNIFIPLIALALLATMATPAESRSVTFYSDGAVVELEVTAAKSFIEIPLPTSIIEGSLRDQPGWRYLHPAGRHPVSTVGFGQG